MIEKKNCMDFGSNDRSRVDWFSCFHQLCCIKKRVQMLANNMRKIMHSILFLHVIFVISCQQLQTTIEPNAQNANVIKCRPWKAITRRCPLCPMSCKIPEVHTRSGFLLLTRTMEKEGLTAVWLGIRRTWLGEYLWLDCTRPSLTFASQNWGSDLNCGGVNVREGTIEAGSCHVKSRGVMCQKTACRSCIGIEERGLCVKIYDTCYIRKEVNLNWENAKGYCIGEGWQIAVIPRATEDFVLRSIRNAFAKKNHRLSSYWIGLRREDWSDIDHKEEETEAELQWGKNQPTADGNCTILIKRGQDFVVEATKCDKRYSALCLSSGKLQHLGVRSQSQCEELTEISNGRKDKITVRTMNSTKESALRPTIYNGAGLIVNIITLLLVAIILILLLLFKRTPKIFGKKGQKTEEGKQMLGMD